MPFRPSVTPAATLPWLCALCACSAADPAGSSSTPSTAATTNAPAQCLPDAGGFLRARLRGAIDADLDWHDAELRCEGGARPDGAGLRVTIAGPMPAGADGKPGRTLRFVFGIDTGAASEEGTALATNLTAIVEGDGALFATRGNDKCTVDHLRRDALADTTAGQTMRDYRVEARGFCLGPASSLDGGSRLLVATFDFAGRVSLERTGVPP